MLLALMLLLWPGVTLGSSPEFPPVAWSVVGPDVDPWEAVRHQLAHLVLVDQGQIELPEAADCPRPNGARREVRWEAQWLSWFRYQAPTSGDPADPGALVYVVTACDRAYPDPITPPSGRSSDPVRDEVYSNATFEAHVEAVRAAEELAAEDGVASIVAGNLGPGHPFWNHVNARPHPELQPPANRLIAADWLDPFGADLSPWDWPRPSYVLFEPGAWEIAFEGRSDRRVSVAFEAALVGEPRAWRSPCDDALRLYASGLDLLDRGAPGKAAKAVAAAREIVDALAAVTSGKARRQLHRSGHKATRALDQIDRGKERKAGRRVAKAQKRARKGCKRLPDGGRDLLAGGGR